MILPNFVFEKTSATTGRSLSLIVVSTKDGIPGPLKKAGLPSYSQASRRPNSRTAISQLCIFFRSDFTDVLPRCVGLWENLWFFMVVPYAHWDVTTCLVLVVTFGVIPLFLCVCTLLLAIFFCNVVCLHVGTHSEWNFQSTSVTNARSWHV